MSLVSFSDLMEHASRGKFAVGYYESWNLESLLAVADAAEAQHSPVLLGFSGIYLPHPQRRTREHLQDYYALACTVASRLTVPACLVFNESPHLDWVYQAADLGFGLVMFTEPASSDQDSLIGDQNLVISNQSQVIGNQSPVSSLQSPISNLQSPLSNLQSPISNLQSLSLYAHAHSVAVEAEMQALEGVGGELAETPDDFHFTDPEAAREFVARTQIDALAVNVGQAHMHGRAEVRLDLERLGAIRQAVDVPLVLHGATSVRREDLCTAIQIGVQKINVGSALKRVYFETLKRACAEIGMTYNPYDVVGSGFATDVLTRARLALQEQVENWMGLFGSAGKSV